MDIEAREAIDRHNSGYPYYALQREFNLLPTRDEEMRAMRLRVVMDELIELECR